jgi:hypothetical protein
MPGGVIYNWLAEIESALPDFRVLILGSKKKVIARSPCKGLFERSSVNKRYGWGAAVNSPGSSTVWGIVEGISRRTGCCRAQNPKLKCRREIEFLG